MIGKKHIKIVNTCENNLKNLTLEIPQNELIVITGVSGSGKSSLAFNTIYAEGQRRYIESLSSYARQFLNQMPKANVKKIEGLSPTISINQKSTINNPRSLVSTTTEIQNYLRLLYSSIGKVFCPHTGEELKAQSPENIVEEILKLPKNRKLILLSPIIQGKKGTHKETLELLQREGFTRVRLNRNNYNLDDALPSLEKNKRHDIEVVIDRLKTNEDLDQTRLTDSVELSLKKSTGDLIILLEDEQGNWQEILMSEHYFYMEKGKRISLSKFKANNFSFNSPHGACSYCSGLGEVNSLNSKEIINTNKALHLCTPLLTKSIRSSLKRYYRELINSFCLHHNLQSETTFEQLTEKQQHDFLYGTEESFTQKYRFAGKNITKNAHFEGIIPRLLRRYREGGTIAKKNLEPYILDISCPQCNGKRLKKDNLLVKIADKNIDDFINMNIIQALDFIKTLKLTKSETLIAKDLLQEIGNRLNFLDKVGLSYLTLNRKSSSLSGGEAQRIRLASQLGNSLVGVTYVLDEPSIGLHQKDNKLLINTLKELRDKGNTVIVVEHDLETILKADHIIEIGPQAGEHGGKLIFQGSTIELLKSDCLTGLFLNETLKLPDFYQNKADKKFQLSLKNVAVNNIKNISVDFPLGLMICVTGVSGSGKSSLIFESLLPSLEKGLAYNAKSIKGLEHIDKILKINQKPIGRTPRSNIATYTKLLDVIRDLFAQTPEAKVKAYDKGRFSFNVKGGRCEECRGDGYKTIEMNFLADIQISCDRCKGKRYNKETLSVLYKGKSIADILDMTVEQALKFFKNFSKIKKTLETLNKVGLSYLRLGQPSTTFSGGEAQRCKIARELSKNTSGHTLYILDEPTTGLHINDIKNLLNSLMEIRDKNNTLIIIEHNIDFIKKADHIIDLGLEGGEQGGNIITYGTPQKIKNHKKSHTAKFL